MDKNVQQGLAELRQKCMTGSEHLSRQRNSWTSKEQKLPAAMDPQDLCDNVPHFTADDFSPKFNLPEPSHDTTVTATPCRQLSFSSSTCNTPSPIPWNSTHLAINSPSGSRGSNSSPQHTTLCGTPCRQLSLSSSTCDTPLSSLLNSTQRSIILPPNSHGSRCGPAMTGAALTPRHDKATSKRKQENAVSPYSPASLLFSSNVGPLKQIQNIMNRNMDSSPIKKKHKMMLPCQKLVFSSHDSILDDSGTASHSNGHCERKRMEENCSITHVSCASVSINHRLFQSKLLMSSPMKQVSLVSSITTATTTTSAASVSPAHLTEGQRPFKSFRSLCFDEDDSAVMTELMNEIQLEDQEVQGFIDARIHVAKMCSPTKVPPCSPVRQDLSVRNIVYEPLAGKENIYPLQKSHSELGASTVKNELRKLDALSSSSNPKMNRCHLETQATIMKAVSKSCEHKENLTGDFSRALLLPVLETGKHKDLQSLSVHTLADVIKGKYDGELASCRIIDCRYPYEYDGGHIKGAELWHLPELVAENLEAKKGASFITGEKKPRHILVFHCEFSVHRGPRAQRLLREIDRAANKENYPALYFPEMYLLEGGYKAFFEKYSELCTPCNYVRMIDPRHKGDMKHFRAKSKSWTAGKKHSKSRVPFPGLSWP